MVITCDETGIVKYYPETKHQCTYSKTQHLRNETNTKEQDKIEGNDDVFFDLKCIIMTEWVPQSQTLYQKYYSEVPMKMEEELRRKFRICGRTTQGESVCQHCCTEQSLANKFIPVREHPPY